MKKIDKHICRLFLKFFLLSLLAFVSIFLISQIFRVIKFVTEGKMTGRDSILYFLTIIPRTLIDVTPLSVLLGGLISMNTMASNLEIISLKTSGVSFRRIIFFPVIISFLISIAIFKISDKIAPRMYEQARILRGSEERERELPIEKDNAFLRTQDNIVYYARNINRITNQGKDMVILELNKDFNRIKRMIISKNSKYDSKEKVWILSDVVITDVEKGSKEILKEFRGYNLKEEPEMFITIGRDPRTLTIKELKEEMRELRKVGRDIKGFLQELAERYSYPFAAFVVSFIGLALGSRYVRGGSARNIGISIGLGYSYYFVSGIFKAFSQNGYINPFVSGWIPNIIFFCLGIYYVKKAEH